MAFKYFPTLWKWKFAIICSYKSISQSPSDYRHINLLPALAKCLEKTVHDSVLFMTTTEQKASEIICVPLVHLVDF